MRREPTGERVGNQSYLAACTRGTRGARACRDSASVQPTHRQPRASQAQESEQVWRCRERGAQPVARLAVHTQPQCAHTRSPSAHSRGECARVRVMPLLHYQLTSLGSRCRSVGSSHLLELLTTSPRTAAHTLCLRGRAQLGGAPRYLCTPHPRPRARARRRACPPRAAHDAQQPHPVTRALAGNWGGRGRVAGWRSPPSGALAPMLAAACALSAS